MRRKPSEDYSEIAYLLRAVSKLKRHTQTGAFSVTPKVISQAFSFLIPLREFLAKIDTNDTIYIDKYGSQYIVETMLCASTDKHKVIAQYLDYGVAQFKVHE